MFKLACYLLPLVLAQNPPLQQQANPPPPPPPVHPAPVQQQISVQPAPIQQQIPAQPAQVQQQIPVQPAQVQQQIPVQPAQVQQQIPVQPAQVQQQIPVQPLQFQAQNPGLPPQYVPPVHQAYIPPHIPHGLDGHKIGSPNYAAHPPMHYQNQEQHHYPPPPPQYLQQPPVYGMPPGAQQAPHAYAPANAHLVDVHHQVNVPQPSGPQHEYELSDDEYRRLQQNNDKLIFDDVAHNSNSSDSESLAAEWERIMTDFMPDMIVTFKLGSGEAEHFHQDVSSEPTLLRGGFFESTDDSSASIAFQIVSPSGKLIYESSKGEGLFKIMTKEKGTYTFAVSNGSWTGQKYVTFVVGAGLEKGLTNDDVSSLDGNVRVLYRMLGDMETQSSYLWLRQKSHLEEINKTATQTYYALIAELLCTGLATMVQLSVIKKIVSHRRMF